ncbi:MAG: hypothetical protein ACI33I_07330 [Clostridium sp.]
MLRDFSDSSKKNLLNLVSEVENEKLSDFTDWIGDRWYDFGEWVGSLNIKNYIDNVNSYHKKVIDKNNTTMDSIEKIFEDVKNINNSYSGIFSNIDILMKNWNIYIETMNTIITPSNGKFNAKEINTSLKSIISSIETCNVECLKNRMVKNIGGEPVFDKDLILEYMKKDVSELSDEEKTMLIDVISELKDTVAVYETLATVGTDELGADILNYVSWVGDSDTYKSFTAVSAHYNGIYIELLDYMSEENEKSNSFASALVKLSYGESDISILGSEHSEKVGALFQNETFKNYLAKYKSEHTEQYFLKLEESEKDTFKASDKLGDINDLIRNKNIANRKLHDWKNKKLTDTDFNRIEEEDAPKFHKKELTLAEFKRQASGKVSFYDGKFQGDWGNLGVVVGQAEAHASISGGLHTVDADGEKKFSPGVTAEIGTSITALEVNYNDQVGNDMLGIYGDLTGTVGRVGANANVGIQTYDEDGDLNFQVGASAKAEAILAEARLRGGINVLGGEVGLSGSVNFGIGAHADVGYKDGVFKFDIGASVGVGVQLGAEIDIGGMVATICDVPESAWDEIKDGWNEITSGYTVFFR